MTMRKCFFLFSTFMFVWACSHTENNHTERGSLFSNNKLGRYENILYYDPIYKNIEKKLTAVSVEASKWIVLQETNTNGSNVRFRMLYIDNTFNDCILIKYDHFYDKIFDDNKLNRSTISDCDNIFGNLKINISVPGFDNSAPIFHDGYTFLTIFDGDDSVGLGLYAYCADVFKDYTKNWDSANYYLLREPIDIFRNYLIDLGDQSLTKCIYNKISDDTITLKLR